MAPLPVIPNCLKTVFIHRGGPHVSATTMHWTVESPGSGDNLAEEFVNMATLSLGGTGGGNPFAAMWDGMATTEIQVTDLSSSLNGTQVLSAPETMGGTGQGEPLPSSAVIVSLHTGLRGPAHRGRWFVGPTAENTCAGGTFIESQRAPVETAIERWVDSMRNSGASGNGHFRLGVASYHLAQISPVLSINVRPILGTMRRRQDRLR